VQVSSIPESLLDDVSRLRAFKVLYLADLTHITESRMANIREYVRNGGAIVASYATSLYGPGKRGSNLERFGLEDLFHVAPLQPEGALKDLLTEHTAMTGGPYDLYLGDRGHATLDKATPLWSFLPVKVLEGGEVWKEIVDGYGLKPVLPGVVVSSYGKGRVVYSASALESLFLQQNSNAVGEFLRSLVTRAASEPPPYEIDAPSALIANLTIRANTMVLHLTNWTGNKLERAGANEYYLAPVENVKVRITVPPGKRVRNVAMLVPAQFKKDQKGATLEVSIPRVEAYQAIRIDLE
jgi:hypothetical protein